ncbi:MAG: aminopeptidase P family protein, partial [Candidatus Aminicenantes bacterium]|nr:aminopeptidase P family protein [Candidatus Aminicenantes bacterium]
ALSNEWLRLRFDRVLPEIMRREGIDMWIVVCREHAEDPVYPTLVPYANMFAWRLSMLVFFDRGAADGVERISVNPYGSGDFNKEIGFHYRPGWTDQPEDPWARLARVVHERAPKRIAVNESAVFPFADGLSATLKAELVQAIGPFYAARLVSAERLAVGWLEKRTSVEMFAFSQFVALNRGVAAEALSEKVIKPGVTTIDDLSWWTRERFAELRVEPWFQPTFYILRRAGQGLGDEARRVILPGDFVRCDIGFSCLGLTTDVQEVAYVLRAGEDDAPQGLRDAMRRGNRLQDILNAEFREGSTGNEILAAALRQARAEGLKPRIYSHPLNYYGHGAGTRIGPDENAPGMGDYPLYADTCWAIELSVGAVIPEWDGQEITLALEQSAVFAEGKVHYPAGRQTKFHLIRGVAVK